jgi:hypothetical protein
MVLTSGSRKKSEVEFLASGKIGGHMAIKSGLHYRVSIAGAAEGSAITMQDQDGKVVFEAPAKKEAPPER